MRMMKSFGRFGSKAVRPFDKLMQDTAVPKIDAVAAYLRTIVDDCTKAQLNMI